MQGRLSPMIKERIQAFPWHYWQEEFGIASAHGIGIMEWTLDQERLYDNPLMTETGRRTIASLTSTYGLRVPSVTCDCVMQAPFYKASGRAHDKLLRDLTAIVQACKQMSIHIVVIPLVDEGRVDQEKQARTLRNGLKSLRDICRQSPIIVCFETDFDPHRTMTFIEEYERDLFGINYDIGNSASLGYDAEEEIKCYGRRIVNVHVKDRVRGGATVPLGKGDADIPAVLQQLTQVGYQGNYILQAARARDGDHVGALMTYRAQVSGWLAPLRV